jgi:hypothetical protein
VKNIVAVAVLMCLLLPASLSESRVPKIIVPAPSSQHDNLDETRVFVWDKYSQAIEKVAKESGVAEAGEISRIWRGHSTILAPLGDKVRMRGTRIDGSVRQPDTLEIIPILKEDTVLQGEWKNIFENTRGATTFHGSRQGEVMMVIVFVPMTETWRGLDGIHGLIHALEMESNSSPPNLRDIEAYIRERSAMEASAYEFVATLAAIIGHERGGQKWLDLLNREVKRVQKEYALTKTFPPPPRGTYRTETEEIFGISLSTFEDRERETVLWISGFLQSLQVLSDQEALEMKKAFFTSAVRRKLLK